MPDLFENYELKFPSRPEARFLVASTLVHGALVATLIVTFYLGGMVTLVRLLAGSDYVDEEYARDEVRELSNVFMLTVKPVKLRYPSGYFAPRGAGERIAAGEKSARPRPTPTPTPLPTPPPAPEPAPPQEEATPAEGRLNQGDKAIAGPGTGENGDPENPSSEAPLVQNPIKLLPKINMRPLNDLLFDGYLRFLKGELNVAGTVHLSVEADRNEDGTMKNMEATWAASSDPSLKKLSKELIQALSASRALILMDGVGHVSMTLSLDQQKVSILIDSVLDSDHRSTEMAKMYNQLITFQRLKTNGRAEANIWNHLSVEPAASRIAIRFEIPREAAADFITQRVSGR